MSKKRANPYADANELIAPEVKERRYVRRSLEKEKKRLKRTSTTVLEPAPATTPDTITTWCFLLNLDAWREVAKTLDQHCNSGLQNGCMSVTDVIHLSRTCKKFYKEMNIEYELLWYRFFPNHDCDAFVQDGKRKKKGDAMKARLKVMYAAGTIGVCLNCHACHYSILNTRWDGVRVMNQVALLNYLGGRIKHSHDTKIGGKKCTCYNYSSYVILDDKVCTCTCLDYDPWRIAKMSRVNKAKKEKSEAAKAARKAAKLEKRRIRKEERKLERQQARLKAQHAKYQAQEELKRLDREKKIGVYKYAVLSKDKDKE